MDLLEYVALQMKRGKGPSEIRELLVQNGYPVYEVENALALEDTKEEKKHDGLKPLKKVKSIPSHVLIFAAAGALIAAGIVTLFIYFF